MLRWRRRGPWADRQLHFIAIGGAGMSGLALVCHRLGARVTGSDRSDSSYMERLRSAGIEPRLGHDAETVPPDAEVVVSTAVPEDNPELQVARRRGQKVIHRGELLAELCRRGYLLAVAGAHGKTTTAAMAVHALQWIGAEPAFFLGGELPGAGEDGQASNADWDWGGWVVAEADESDASFLALSPEVAVVTGVELDHHAHWSSLAELSDAFARFVEPAQAVAVHAGVDLGDLQGKRLIRFALADEPEHGAADLVADAIEVAAGGSRFRTSGCFEVEVELAVPGRHNVANALAALSGLELGGADIAAAAGALASFPGVARRLELKGSRDGARIYDDYAHHPTEVGAALEAARTLTSRRLIAVFQPHLYSRTRALAAEFGRSLAAADEIAVLDVYPAREQPVGELAGVSGLDVAKAAADAAEGKAVWWLPDAEAAAAALAPRLGDGDVLLTLGAGDIHILAESLVEDPA